MIILLLIILIGFSIYLLFMRKDEANKDRLLNVLYAYLSVCYQLSSVTHFVHYLTLSSGHTDTVLFCLLGRCRIFVASFILQMYLQISVVTSISHYNPSLYLDISLHWRRLPTLCLQFLASAVILGGIEHLTTGFGDICIGEAVLYKIIWLAFPLKAMNLLLQLGVVVDSFWGWSRIELGTKVKRRGGQHSVLQPPVPNDNSSSRFQPGEGPSRGLLRDYEPSDGPI